MLPLNNKFHSITERKNRHVIAKTMCMSTEQDMIVVIAEATTNARAPRGRARQWLRGMGRLGGSRE